MSDLFKLRADWNDADFNAVKDEDRLPSGALKGMPPSKKKKDPSEKKSTLLVTQESLTQAMQEARATAQSLDRGSDQHKILERMYNFINEILKKTPQEMQEDGASHLTDYFDDAKMPQFASKLKSSMEQIRNIKTQSPTSSVAASAKQAAMDGKIKLQARDALAGIADTVSFSPKQGVLIAKHNYYYTHGMDERKFAHSIVKALSAIGLKVNVVTATNHWHAYPADSWFECRFTVEPSPIADGNPAKEFVPTPGNGIDTLNSPENPSSVAAPAPIMSSKKKADNPAPVSVGTRPSPSSAAPSTGRSSNSNSNAGSSAPSGGSGGTSNKSHSPSTVPVIATEKTAMALNYEQVLAPLGFMKDENAPDVDAEVWWNPAHEDGGPSSSGLEAVVVLEDGNWEAMGGGGANDIIGEGHGPETLQDWIRTEGAKKLNKRGAAVKKRADEVENLEEEPILDDTIPPDDGVADELPIEDGMPEDAAPMAPAMDGMAGLDPNALSTPALGGMIKSLSGSKEFMEDRAAALWIEQISSVLKSRPVDQKAASDKAAKSHSQSVKCDCGNKAMSGSDMCGSCEKEYANSQEGPIWSKKDKAASTTMIPSGWEGTVNRLKNAGIENSIAVAHAMKAEGYTAHRAAFLISRNPAVIASKFAGVPPVNQDTLDVVEGGKRVPEIAQAHSEQDDNTGIKRPATVLPEKLAFASTKIAGEMTAAKALKACEDAQEDLKKLYLSLKSVTSFNNAAPVRNAVEAVYSASVLFEDAIKSSNKMMMADEAEEEAVEASKKKEASVDVKSPFFSLNIAAAE